MQERHLNELVSASFAAALLGPKKAESPKKVKADMEVLADKNKADLPNLPLSERTPTSDELVEMRQYAVDYKKNNKKASKREVRKAVQEKFNIRIYR
jgi:hypothetical protein